MQKAKAENNPIRMKEYAIGARKQAKQMLLDFGGTFVNELSELHLVRNRTGSPKFIPLMID